MRKEFIGNIVLPDRILYGGSVVLGGGRIVEIREKVRTDTDRLPYIFPGLVDIHNHGGMGHDYMEATEESFQAIAGHLARHGVTTAQCTTVSAPLPRLQEFLSFYRHWTESRQSGETGCRFCGVHIEGPYISPGKRGAHPAEVLLTPEDGYGWILDNRDVIREITVAPELPGMPRMIRELCGAGILVSGGHDDGEPEDIEAAVEAGMRHCTHIYCAMSTLHKTGGQRRCGLCEYAMTHEGLTAEMIADNHHTPPWLARMIYRAKGADRLCLISDAIAPAGLEESGRRSSSEMEEGRTWSSPEMESRQLFCLGTGEDCTKVYVEDGVALVEDGSCYAGSVQALDAMIRNLVRDANIPLVDAVKMASLTPAVILGLDGECGSIKVGKRADLCTVNQNLEILETVVGGMSVYRREDYEGKSAYRRNEDCGKKCVKE